MKNKEISRLIYGGNFSNIYKYVNENNNSYVYYLNQYLKIKKMPDLMNDNNMKKNSMILSNELNIKNLENNIMNIYSLSVDYLVKCKVDIDNIINDSIIKESKNKNKKGIFIYSYEHIKYEDFILDIYLNETKNLPNNKTILIWNKHTSKSQLLSFIYFSILYKKNCLFLLVIKEEIPKEKYYYFFEKMDEMKENIEKMKTCLIIIYSKIDGEFLRSFRNIEHKIYEYKEIKQSIINENILCYSSKVSGLGKSEIIINEFKKIKEKNNIIKYIYFPISGSIDEEEIINRLMKIKEENVYFHIDIIEINDKTKNIIRDFLFSFIILKLYFYENKIFCYQSSNYQIVIELHSIHRRFSYFKLL